MALWENLTNWKSKIKFNRNIIKDNDTRITDLENAGGSSVDLENVETNINPVSNGVLNLGINGTNHWNTVNSNNINASGTLNLKANNVLGLSINNSSVKTYEHFYPVANGLTNLGLINNKWNKIYSNNIEVGNAYLSAIYSNNSLVTIMSDLTPGANNTFDLGSNSLSYSDIYSTNAVTVTSDERKKELITDSDLGLDFIMRLNAVHYKLKDSTYKKELKDENGDFILDENGDKTYETITVSHNRKHYGFTTQQVKSVLDSINKDTKDFGAYVKEDINDINSPESLRYTEFIAIQTKAIQELKEEINKLKLDNNLI